MAAVERSFLFSDMNCECREMLQTPRLCLSHCGGKVWSHEKPGRMSQAHARRVLRMSRVNRVRHDCSDRHSVVSWLNVSLSSRANGHRRDGHFNFFNAGGERKVSF